MAKFVNQKLLQCQDTVKLWDMWACPSRLVTKAPPLQKRVRGGWREVLLDAQPDILGWSSCILKLQSSSDLIAQYYVVNWQYPCIENVLFITKSFLKNNCCSDIDMSPQVFAMHTHLLCLKIQLYDISDDIR